MRRMGRAGSCNDGWGAKSSRCDRDIYSAAALRVGLAESLAGFFHAVGDGWRASRAKGRCIA